LQLILLTRNDREARSQPLTRARYGIVMIGNAAVLGKQRLWACLLSHFKDNGTLVEGPLNNLKQSMLPFRASGTIDKRELWGDYTQVSRASSQCSVSSYDFNWFFSFFSTAAPRRCRRRDAQPRGFRHSFHAEQPGHRPRRAFRRCESYPAARFVFFSTPCSYHFVFCEF
jgi:hypothetical protein